MNLNPPVILLILLLIGSYSYGQNNVVERSDWVQYFDQFDTKGTIVVVDEREVYPKNWVYDNSRALKRYSPASTYKIPHTLFALDAGVVEDEFQVFEWDGVKRDYSPPSHHQDQDLRSAMRYSVFWVYQGFAKALGKRRTQRYLTEINYGNADSGTDKGMYWVQGNLAVSAYEQISFLKGLYNNQLPFSLEHQRIVKSIIEIDSGEGWVIRAKTGWQGSCTWWVGWVEWPTGPVFFALNMDTPNGTADIFKREAITRMVLRSLNALPGE